MGSLIHYFALEYNENYFTILNIAFYGVGLPVTYLQKKFDIFYGNFCFFIVLLLCIRLVLLLFLTSFCFNCLPFRRFARFQVDLQNTHSYVLVCADCLSLVCTFCRVLWFNPCLNDHRVRYMGRT